MVLRGALLVSSRVRRKHPSKNKKGRSIESSVLGHLGSNGKPSQTKTVRVNERITASAVPPLYSTRTQKQVVVTSYSSNKQQYSAFVD